MLKIGKPTTHFVNSNYEDTVSKKDFIFLLLIGTKTIILKQVWISKFKL